MVGCFECFCFIVAIPDLSWAEKTSIAGVFIFLINGYCRAHNVFYKYSCPGTTAAFIVCVAVVYRVIFFYVEVKIEEGHEPRASSYELLKTKLFYSDICFNKEKFKLAARG